MVNNQHIDNEEKEFFPSHIVISILIVIIILCGLARYRLADVPLERDEGEYAYAGQLILQGIPPYKNVYNMKFPGIYAAYAFILACFGQTHTSIHIALILINTITIVLIFLLAKQLMGTIGALTAAAGYAIMSMLQSVQGVFANAEHFVILFSLGGLLVLYKGIDKNNRWALFSSGILLGISMMMKQHGVFFIVMGCFYILSVTLLKRPIEWRLFGKHFLLLISGPVLIFGLVCLILALVGTFDNFWFWSFKYARAYISQVPLEHAWKMFSVNSYHVASSAPLLWLLACLGLIGFFKGRQSKQDKFFIGAFVLFSFLAICPGLYFRPHYFQLLLPAIALLVGMGIDVVRQLLIKVKSPGIRHGILLLIPAIFLTTTVLQHKSFLFEMTSLEVCRSTYGYNPFPESIKIASFIKEHTDADDRIAVIGSEPQIYFYSQRRSATGHIYTYALMEKHDYALKMQEQMVKDIEKEKPAFMVFINIPYSWLKKKDSHNYIFKWFDGYTLKLYKPAGVVEILPGESLYSWFPNIKWPPGSPYWIMVLERKDRSK